MKNFGEAPVEQTEKKEEFSRETIDGAFLFLASGNENESERKFLDELVREICKSKKLPNGHLEQTRMGYVLQYDDAQSSERKNIDVDTLIEDVNRKTGEYVVRIQAYNRAQSAEALIDEAFALKASAEAVSTYAAQEAAKEERWQKEEEERKRMRNEQLPLLIQFAHKHKDETVRPDELGDARSNLEAVFEWKLEPEDSVTFKWMEDAEAWQFFWKRGEQTMDVLQFDDIEQP